MAEYTSDNIEILEGLTPVRLRPGMYVGGRHAKALQHLLHEIVDNAIDEAQAGHCTEISVELDADGKIMTVTDNGRGIPTGNKTLASGKKISALDAVFTILHAGGKFGGGGYSVSGGLHGVGASVTNALSKWLEVESRHGKSVFQARYERGEVIKAAHQVRKLAAGEATGTTVRWRYDDKDTYGAEGVFNHGVKYDPDAIEEFLRLKSFLVPQVTFRLTMGDSRVKVFRAKRGIAEMVEHLNANHKPVNSTVVMLNTADKQHKGKPYATAEDTVPSIQVALQWTDSDNREDVSCFVNVVPTPGWGEPQRGLSRAITKVINELARERRKLKDKEPPFKPEDVFFGLTAVLSVEVLEPQFEGQTKDKLGNEEAYKAVNAFVTAAFAEWLREKKHATLSAVILEQVLLARDMREASRKATKSVQKAKSVFSSNLPGKLDDCRHTGPRSRPVEERELFIVEGDSAAGGAGKKRDPDFQAILPLKGKPMNVMQNAKPLENAEITDILMALGGRKAQMGRRNVAELDPDKQRYGKVIFLVDADDDGSHIAMLLMTMFHEFFDRLLREGRVFLAKPPLFRISYLEKGKRKNDYAWTAEEFTQVMKKRPGAKPMRFKGLGEMEASELKEFCLDPATRQLMQVVIGDPLDAQKALTLLMGSNVGPRKEWFEERGLEHVIEGTQ